MMFPDYQQRAKRHSIMAALAQRTDESEVDYLARVVAVWNALPTFQQNWFPEFAQGLQQRLATRAID